jgi:hypothetical protein
VAAALAAALGAAPALAAEPGLVAHWSFDEGAGATALDVSGNGHHGAILGAAYTAGVVGRALDFDGFSSVVRVPNAPALQPATALTIEAWVKLRSNAGPKVIVSKWDDINREWSYIFKKHNDQPGLRMELSRDIHTDLADVGGARPLPLGQWVHVATTFEGTTVRLYVDGKLDAEGQVFVPAPIDASATDLLIGAVNPTGPTEHLDGAIDEVRLWNRALSAAEIAARAAALQPVTVTVRSGDPAFTYPDASGLLRDAANACTHKAGYPDGAIVTEDAYVIPPFPGAWTLIPGTSWINWTPTPFSPGMTYDLPPNFASYESSFAVPAGYVPALELQYAADDWVDVFLNGRQIVDQSAIVDAAFGGAGWPPGFCTFTCVSTATVGDPAIFAYGRNVFTFVQRDPDFGGGLDYLATITLRPVAAVLGDLRAVVLALPDGAFRKPSQRAALLAMIDSDVALVAAGSYREARDRLVNGILPKMDGFATAGAADQTDIVVSKAGQAQAYPIAVAALRALSSLL